MDDDSMGYYLIFNIPIVIYTLFFIYSFFKYEKDFLYKKQPQAAGDHGEILLGHQGVSASQLTPALYNKMYQNMRLQRVYFIFWFISILPNYFMLSQTGLVWYSVFTCLHPVVIMGVALWALSINA